MLPLEAALELHHELGCNVFPLPRGSKSPTRPWREFQRHKQTDTEIVELFEKEEDANIAVVCGKVSNLIVLDCDAPDALKRLGYGVPVTPIAETARGRHYYFRGTAPTTQLADGLDVRAEGAYVVAPPSLHPTGKPYQWVIPPTETEPAPCPDWLLEMLKQRRQALKKEHTSLQKIISGTPEGQRNISSVQLIGYLLTHLPQEHWETIAWPLVLAWNSLNKPPLDEKQLRYTFNCIAQKEAQNAKKRKDINQLLKILRVALDNSKLSLRQIAQKAGVSKSYLSKLKFQKTIASRSQKTIASRSHNSQYNPIYNSITTSMWTLENGNSLLKPLSFFECPHMCQVGGDRE